MLNLQKHNEVVLVDPSCECGMLLPNKFVLVFLWCHSWPSITSLNFNSTILFFKKILNACLAQVCIQTSVSGDRSICVDYSFHRCSLFSELVRNSRRNLMVESQLLPGGGVGVLPYIDYTGMCRWLGYGFQAEQGI